MLLGFRADLQGQQFIEEISIGKLPFYRLFQARDQFLLDLIEPQAMAMFMQPFEQWGVHCASPPLL